VARVTESYRRKRGFTIGFIQRHPGHQRLGSCAVTPTDQAASVCLDVGSTWTKAVLVHADGSLAGFA
jgi:hypothetical protein